MKRILLAIITAFSSFLVVGISTHTSAASDATPPVGAWTWCTETIVNGCIEAVTTISPEKVETVYTSMASLPSGLTVTANCSANGPVNTCDTNRYVTRDDGKCVEASTWGGRFTTPSIEFDIKWEGKSGWDLRVRFSTGNFQPAFAIGHGTTAASTTNDGDGTYTYTHTSKMEKAYSAKAPLATAIAISQGDWVHIQVWPRDHLAKPADPLLTSMPMPGNSSSSSSSTSSTITPSSSSTSSSSTSSTITPSSSSTTSSSTSSTITPSSSSTTSSTIAPAATGCKYYPFDGAWAEANAQSFSWSYSSGDMSLSVPKVLKFIAAAPHYLPQISGQPLEVMPARVQVFLPVSYFSALGYQSLSEFNAASYSIATEDGQATKPTATVQDTGVLINLGLQHYSSPNPSVTFVAKGEAVNKTTTMPATTPKPTASVIATPVSVPSTVSTPAKVALPKMAKRATKTLASFISYKASGTKKWKVSGGCTIVGLKLRAPAKATTCKLTLTVLNTKKKIVATKSQSIRVS